jgi:two-component system sensor histidine kinase MprB
MSLRLKIVAALVLLAAGATTAIGAFSYVSTRQELNDVVDRSLIDAANHPNQIFAPRRGVGGPALPEANEGLPGGTRATDVLLAQLIRSDGLIVVAPISGALPIGDIDLAIANGSDTRDPSPRDVKIDGEQFRMLTIRVQGGAVQLARSARETQHALDVIRNRTLWSVGLVIIGATLIGWLIARQVTRRLTRLTQAADDVALTGRLDVEVPVSGSDETGRLGSALNGMLGALAKSRHQQQQLVQDAGHELRTPLTSLRTNVSVLRRFDDLEPVARQQLIADLDSETKELSALVNELVDLATDRRDGEPDQECDLGALCEQAAARVRRRTGREITVVSDGSTVRCRPNAVDRAILNVIDNAAKFSDSGPIEVEVSSGRVSVTDHGGGIPDDDLPHVFDRFYRSVRSRSQPGSGLGLAIVRDIVESHGGTVFAESRGLAGDDHGATVGFTLPTVPATLPPPSVGR